MGLLKMRFEQRSSCGLALDCWLIVFGPPLGWERGWRDVCFWVNYFAIARLTLKAKMLSPDSWLRQQLWRQLWKGPGAVSTFLSTPVPLICAGLSAICLTELQGASLCILSINILLGALLILADEIDLRRNHCLGLLRFSAAKSRDRIQKLGINSKEIDRFVSALWSNPELNFRFRRTRLRSIELIVLALDILSRTASRYGRCGKRVFEANQDPIVNAMQLFECLPLADAEAVLVGPLKHWVAHPPEFDPEGWALPLFEKY
jgi:hypothetical protein